MDQNRITNGVIRKEIILFTIPIIVGTIFQQLYNAVDAIIVGRCLGKEALAAVGGSATVITMVVVNFFTGLSSGASVLIAQYFGAKDEEQIHKILHTAYAFAIYAGLLILLAGCFGIRPLLVWMKTPADTMADALLYMRVYFLGVIAVLIFNMGSAIMRAMGDSRRPLYYLIVCCLLNIALDLLFIVVFHMGVEGAALATVIAQVVSGALVTFSLSRDYAEVKLSFRKIHMDRKSICRILGIGIPAGMQGIVYGITNVVAQTTVNAFGTDTTAAWAAYYKVDTLFWTVCTAFGVAVMTFAGQNLGAQKKRRIISSVRWGFFWSLLLCGLIVLMEVFLKDPLMGMFTKDQNVVRIGAHMMAVLLPYYMMFVFVEIFSGALRGLGYVLYPTLMILGGVGLVRVPWLLIAVPKTHMVETLLMNYPLGWLATLVCLIPYYFLIRRKELQDGTQRVDA